MASDQKETTVVLTVDTSNSMAATDVHPEPHRGSAQRGAGSDQRVCPKNAQGRHRLVRTRRARRCSRRRTTAPPSTRSLRSAHADAAAPRSGLRSTAPWPRCKASHSRRQGPRDRRHLRRQEHRGQAQPAGGRTRGQGGRRARVHGLARHRRTAPSRKHGKTVNVPPDPDHAAARRRRQRRALLPRRGRHVAAQRLPHDRQRGRAPSTSCATSASRSWQPQPCSSPVAACSRWPGSAA